MEMIEVDVKLFIKCRMCLDEDGVYQIIPSINQLIKECFDIDTDPFDGLPQLICKKCKFILNDYHTTKTTFKEKQQKLRERLQKKVELESTQLKSETSGGNGLIRNGELPTLPDPPLSPVKAEEPEASDEPRRPASSAADVQVVLDNCHKQNNATWKRIYNKHYFCKICSKSYQKYSSITRHASTHQKIIKKHKKVFRSYCSVQLNKVDSKKNCTGNLNTVVYNGDKIISNNGNCRYHTLYLKKGYSEKNTTPGKGKATEKRTTISVDSPEEEEIIKTKKRKTQRLRSGSSTKTTVLDDTANNVMDLSAQDDKQFGNANAVIGEEASHSSAGVANSKDANKQNETKASIANYKAIQNIVTMCQKKYIKKIQTKNETKQPVSESSLKHKVLSLGRKVIHQAGFECTGLLRYVEHKDLDISWQPAICSDKKRNCNFVRINTKLKSRKDLENDNNHWKDLYKIKFSSKQGTNANNNLNVGAAKTKQKVKSKLQPELQNNVEQVDHVLTNHRDELNSKNKLLNKSPVANPKQLLKKSATEINDTVPKTYADMPIIDLDPVENEEVPDSQMCMPVITSTRSLLATEEEKQTEAVAEKPAPRIKVKPPSELMCQRALDNQNKLEDLRQVMGTFNDRSTNFPHLLTIYTNPCLSRSELENQSSVMVTSTITQKTNYTEDTNLEYVTLHCLELPNERTKFPFQYFKRVLQFHGFELLDINEELPAHFIDLVQFRLILKQDTKRPLGVQLSLFCSKNSFCFAFKDTEFRKFDPNQLPAFWQWELLKIYQGDVVSKILQNAAKISKEVHVTANNFLCLLKSIKCISEP